MKRKINITGFIFFIITLYIIITFTIYRYKNHHQTDIELISNTWYVLTCQFDKNYWSE